MSPIRLIVSRRSNAAWLLMAAAVCTLAACESSIGPEELSRLQVPPGSPRIAACRDSVDVLIHHWRSRKPESYTFVYRSRSTRSRVEEDTSWVMITVKEDAIHTVQRLADGRYLTREERGRYTTIDGLFDAMRNAVTNYGFFSVSVDLDERYGYPRRSHNSFGQQPSWAFEIAAFTSLR